MPDPNALHPIRGGRLKPLLKRVKSGNAMERNGLSNRNLLPDGRFRAGACVPRASGS
jgi:hypothetical protein